jgi:hypothetical protein
MPVCWVRRLSDLCAIAIFWLPVSAHRLLAVSPDNPFTALHSPRKSPLPRKEADLLVPTSHFEDKKAGSVRARDRNRLVSLRELSETDGLAPQWRARHG